MRDKNLMIGVVFCFAISIIFLLVIIWEIKKSIDHDERVQQMSKNSNDVEVENREDISFLNRLRNSIGKTRTHLITNISNVILGKKHIDEDLLDDLEEVLIGSDIGTETTRLIMIRKNS